MEESLIKAQVKKKTLAVLSNEENKVKLKNLISKAENRLTELAEQWNEVQSPLLEEHQTLKRYFLLIRSTGQVSINLCYEEPEKYKFRFVKFNNKVWYY